jgi:hypothetical protein
MAEMVGVWIYVPPRNRTDPMNLTVGWTTLLDEAEVRKLGDSLMTVQLRVMKLPIIEAAVYVNDNLVELGPAGRQVGPNSFTDEVIVPRQNLGRSAEGILLAEVRAIGPGVATDWRVSQEERVLY